MCISILSALVAQSVCCLLNVSKPSAGSVSDSLLALMTILSQSLLTLVRRDLVSLLFLTVWHIRL